MVEGLSKKQEVACLKAGEGGRCTMCTEVADVAIYETDVEFVALCKGCDREDDKDRVINTLEATAEAANETG